MKINVELLIIWRIAQFFIIVVSSLGILGQSFLFHELSPRIFPVRTEFPVKMSYGETWNDALSNASALSTRLDERSTAIGDPPELTRSDGQKPSLKKYHHLTVCMVPPESSVLVWETITKCRTELKDPGLFRWPPHANLLYPFIDLRSSHHQSNTKEAGDDDNIPKTFNVDPNIIRGLMEACSKVDPFCVKLHQFGTFGSKKRGVLWMYPDSCYLDETEISKVPPLIRLQSSLVQSFPECNDQNLKSNDGFNPHMTVSHFTNHEEALAAQSLVEQWWPIEHMNFVVKHIYLLYRSGDAGQFLRVADIPLGSQNMNEVIIHPSPIPFLHMPSIEADWVYEERMKLKQRRNGQWRSRSRKKGAPSIQDINLASAGDDFTSQSD